MFKISGEKEFFYKVGNIKKGTTSNGGQYTFISISNKPKNSETYENAQVMMWQDVNVKKGDYIAIYNAQSIGVYNDAVGFKNYVGAKIEAAHIKIKEAQEEEKTQTQQNQTTNKVESNTNIPNQTNSVEPQSEKLKPIDDNNLPF